MWTWLIAALSDCPYGHGMIIGLALVIRPESLSFWLS